MTGTNAHRLVPRQYVAMTDVPVAYRTFEA